MINCISYIDRRLITHQTIDAHGRLVTHFKADTDPVTGHRAGIIVNEPCTPAQAAAWEERYDSAGEHGGILSETVTRFNRLFWDRGTFTATE